MPDQPRLIGIDVETTGLRPGSEDVWEVACIDLDTDTEHVWRIEPRPGVVARMHPDALAVNHYHSRTCAPDWTWDDPVKACEQLADLLDGAHLVGASPAFDTAHLIEMFRRHYIVPPAWRHRLVDVEAMAAGLFGWTVPRSLSDTAAELGIDVDGYERHTALGDARLTRDVHRAILDAADRAASGRLIVEITDLEHKHRSLADAYADLQARYDQALADLDSFLAERGMRPAGEHVDPLGGA